MAAQHQPLLLSYGGGHAQIIIAIAKELDRRGQLYTLVGLTTAETAFRRAGLDPLNIAELIDPLLPEAIRRRAAELAPASDHPDISDGHTTAYYTIGYADLVERFGLDEAESRYASHGRKAFEPVTAFARFFSRLNPSIVVSTTSPRFELAALRTARRNGIPSLAIGDMYLIAEQEWILTDDYAGDLTVISEEVAEMLIASGRASSRIHITGNPAFDALAPTPEDPAVRTEERSRLGIEGRTCILWPLGGAADEVAGRHLLEPAAVAHFLDVLCARDPSFTYVLRPHPNWPVNDLTTRHGTVDSSVPLERALLMADVVCVEASTVGLQAVLKGIPTICFNFADYVIYPGLGWAAATDDFAELERMLVERTYFAPPTSLQGHVGGATARVCDLLQRLALT